MKKYKPKVMRWVKRNSPLHKQLETARIVGANEDRRKVFKILVEECVLSDDFIEYLFTEKYPIQ